MCGKGIFVRVLLEKGMKICSKLADKLASSSLGPSLELGIIIFGKAWACLRNDAVLLEGTKGVAFSKGFSMKFEVRKKSLHVHPVCGT